MEVFNAYAEYYDLLYKDKDYSGEIHYIEKFIRQYKPDTKTILDLGCGTGKHDFLLAGKSFDVTGVELSQPMINIANKTLLSYSHYSETLRFIQGDIREFDINEKFDLIISLFHVMSYQVSNKDLEFTLNVVKKHLKDDGIFLFDFWYGPAVLNERPEPRVKELENNEINVERFAEPTLRINENLVDVHYKIQVKEKNNGHINEINETHCMRYFFVPEIELLLKYAHLDLIHCEEWMTGNVLSEKSWSAFAVAGNYKSK